MRIKLLAWLNRGRRGLSPGAGQGLVETALILPILILMLLGVFEVGWALRAYLTLANANREAARFASRGAYLDFDGPSFNPTGTCAFDQDNDPLSVGYCKVVSHTIDSLAGQLPLHVDPPNQTGAMIVTYYTIEPRGFNCAGDPTCASFDCSRFKIGSPNFVSGANVSRVEYPVLTVPPSLVGSTVPTYYNQILVNPSGITATVPMTIYHYHRGLAAFSRIDPAVKVAELRAQNNELNCQLAKKRLPTTGSNAIIVENIYYQEQLVGLPVITSLFPNPIPFYAHTSMRVNATLRTAAEDDPDKCLLAPIVLPISATAGVAQRDSRTVQISSSLGTPQRGRFSFVQWGSSTTVAQSLADSEKSHTAFVSADNAADTTLNITDWATLSNTSVGAVDAQLQQLIDDEVIIRVPVWYDDATCSTVPCVTANGSSFEIYNFAKIRLTGKTTNSLTFVYWTPDPQACSGPGTDRN